VSYNPPERGIPHVGEIIVAIGSAGAFQALYQVICKVLEKNKDREIIVVRKDKQITIKGHSLPEEKDIIRQIAPELIRRPK